MNGLITEIQRFSLHDGPGIRSTVFTKGCNMQCRWCHNPETISAKAQMQFFPSKCIGCQSCEAGEDTVSANPEDLFVEASGKVRHYRGNCHAKALVKIGEERTAQSVLEEVLQDRPFYERSKGGVTLSGGEVSMQSDFALELLTLLKQEGIHTAIETNLATSWKSVEGLLPVLDLVMFDIKSMNEQKHREWTGISNKRIIENAQKLAATHMPLIVRTPVIPGFNDSETDIQSIAEFVHAFAHLDYYELLSYNPLGADKYRCLGKTYALEDAVPVSQGKMSHLKTIAAQVGMQVRAA